MALFSQRFWIRLSSLDARVVVTYRRKQAASERMLVAQRLVTGGGLRDFWLELRSTTSIARVTAAELHQFCVGRSRSPLKSERLPSSGFVELDSSPHYIADAHDESQAL